MRVALLSTASVIGLLAFAGPSAAGSDMTGVGQLYVGAGTTDVSFFGGKLLDDPFLYGGKAKGYWPLSPDVHLQVDLLAEKKDGLGRSGFASDEDPSTLGAAVHLLHPFEKRARFGVAGSIWIQDNVFPFTSQADSDTYGLVGLEGQFFGTDWTATGQAGVFASISCSGDSDGCAGLNDGAYVRGKLRYFLTDNTAFSLETTQMWGSLDDDFFNGKTLNVETAIWSLEAEHKFDDSPFSGFIALSHENTQSEGFYFGEPSSANTRTVSIGVKFYLDQPTLRSNDQTGAELDTPQFGNALATASTLAIVNDLGAP